MNAAFTRAHLKLVLPQRPHFPCFPSAQAVSLGKRGVSLPSTCPDGTAPLCENSTLAHALTAHETY